jgi:hypothetical protein
VYSSWQNINYFHRPYELERRKQRERRAAKYATEFMLWCTDNFETDLYWEWPKSCSGWSQYALQKLEQGLEQRGLMWLSNYIDGCRYQMRLGKTGLLNQKSWNIKSTSERFHAQFQRKVCTKDHDHERIEGNLTNASSYYPEPMCRSLAHFWQNEDRLQPHREVLTLTSTVTPPEDTFDMQELLVKQKEEQTPTTDDELAFDKLLRQLHKASGHPTNRNLAKILKDAHRPSWQVQKALDLKCPDCDELRPHAASNPEAATYAIPAAWSHVGTDVSE